MLRNIDTTVLRIKKGSIIIHFGIEANTEDLLHLAIRNINETAEINGSIQVDGNFTFPIIDLEFYTMDPMMTGLKEYCYLDDECRDSIIVCPPIGCDVICGGLYSCANANIIYTGSNQDEGRVKVECTNDHACYNLNISANNVYNAEIHCTTQHNDYTCYQTTLYAKNANSVNLYSANQNGYGFYYSQIYCNNALRASLFAYGSLGFYQRCVICRKCRKCFNSLYIWWS